MIGHSLNCKAIAIAALAIAVACFLVACASRSSQSSIELPPDPQWHASSTFHLVGTVQHNPEIGGPRFFNVLDRNGKRYEPVNLPETFQVDGRRIKADVQLLDNYVSVTMTGPGIQILRIYRQ